jgi:hypothetical protein
MTMRETMKDLKFWALALFIAALILLSYRTAVELLTGNTAKIEAEHAAIYDRLERLELSKTPATMKRYTSDDAAKDKAELMAEIKLIQKLRDERQREIDQIKARLSKLEKRN